MCKCVAFVYSRLLCKYAFILTAICLSLAQEFLLQTAENLNAIMTESPKHTSFLRISTFSKPKGSRKKYFLLVLAFTLQIVCGCYAVNSLYFFHFFSILFFIFFIHPQMSFFYKFQFSFYNT